MLLFLSTLSSDLWADALFDVTTHRAVVSSTTPATTLTDGSYYVMKNADTNTPFFVREKSGQLEFDYGYSDECVVKVGVSGSSYTFQFLSGNYLTTLGKHTRCSTSEIATTFTVAQHGKQTSALTLINTTNDYYLGRNDGNEMPSTYSGGTCWPYGTSYGIDDSTWNTLDLSGWYFYPVTLVTLPTANTTFFNDETQYVASYGSTAETTLSTDNIYVVENLGDSHFIYETGATATALNSSVYKRVTDLVKLTAAGADGYYWMQVLTGRYVGALTGLGSVNAPLGSYSAAQPLLIKSTSTEGVFTISSGSVSTDGWQLSASKTSVLTKNAATAATYKFYPVTIHDLTDAITDEVHINGHTGKSYNQSEWNEKSNFYGCWWSYRYHTMYFSVGHNNLDARPHLNDTNTDYGDSIRVHYGMTHDGITLQAPRGYKITKVTMKGRALGTSAKSVGANGRSQMLNESETNRGTVKWDAIKDLYGYYDYCTANSYTDAGGYSQYTSGGSKISGEVGGIFLPVDADNNPIFDTSLYPTLLTTTDSVDADNNAVTATEKTTYDIGGVSYTFQSGETLQSTIPALYFKFPSSVDEIKAAGFSVNELTVYPDAETWSPHLNGDNSGISVQCVVYLQKLDSASNVTITIKDLDHQKDGEPVTLATVTRNVRLDINSKPTVPYDLDRDYCTYYWNSTATELTTDEATALVETMKSSTPTATLYLKRNADFPFREVTLSDEGTYAAADTANMYYVGVGGSNFLYYDATANANCNGFRSSDTKDEPAEWFGFIGDPFNGYRIFNHAISTTTDDGVTYTPTQYYAVDASETTLTEQITYDNSATNTGTSTVDAITEASRTYTHSEPADAAYMVMNTSASGTTALLNRWIPLGHVQFNHSTGKYYNISHTNGGAATHNSPFYLAPVQDNCGSFAQDDIMWHYYRANHYGSALRIWAGRDNADAGSIFNVYEITDVDVNICDNATDAAAKTGVLATFPAYRVRELATRSITKYPYMSRDFCTYSNTFTGTWHDQLNKTDNDSSIYTTYAFQLFTPTTADDSTGGSYTTYYMAINMTDYPANKKYVSWDGSATSSTLNAAAVSGALPTSLSSEDKEKYQWYFTGDPYNGFRIHPVSQPTYALTTTADVSADNVTSLTPYPQEVSESEYKHMTWRVDSACVAAVVPSSGYTFSGRQAFNLLPMASVGRSMDTHSPVVNDSTTTESAEVFGLSLASQTLSAALILRSVTADMWTYQVADADGNVKVTVYSNDLESGATQTLSIGSLVRDFCTYAVTSTSGSPTSDQQPELTSSSTSQTVSLTGTGAGNDNVVTYTFTWAGPFNISTEGDYKWYAIKMHLTNYTDDNATNNTDGKKGYIVYDSSASSWPIKSGNESTKNTTSGYSWNNACSTDYGIRYFHNGTALWAFEGNPYDNFYIINKSAVDAGADAKALKYNTSSTSPVLASLSEASTWFIEKSTKVSSNTKGFTIRANNGLANYYFNDSGWTNLGYWINSSAKSDQGSQCFVERADVTVATYLQNYIDAPNDAFGGYFTSTTATDDNRAAWQAKITSFQDISDADYTGKEPLEAMEAMLAATKVPITEGYYRVKSYTLGTYASLASPDATYSTGTTDNESRAGVNLTEDEEAAKADFGSVFHIGSLNTDSAAAFSVQHFFMGTHTGNNSSDAKQYGWDPQISNRTGATNYKNAFSRTIYGPWARINNKGSLSGVGKNYCYPSSNEVYAGAISATSPDRLWYIFPADEVTASLTTFSTDGANYRTFYADFPVTVPEGAVAYNVTTKHEKEDDTDNTFGGRPFVTTQTIEAGKTIPALTPVILKSTSASSLTLAIPTSSADWTNSDVTSSILTGEYREKPVPTSGTTYVFNEGTLNINGTETQIIGFYKYTGSTVGANKIYYHLADGASAPAFVLQFDADAETVTMTGAGYGTLYYDENLVVPSGIRGAAVVLNGNQLDINYCYDEGDIIPAYTAVLLKADEGVYTFNVTDEEGTAPAFNDLRGTLTDSVTVGGKFYYKLSLSTDGTQVGFYYGAPEGGAFINGAHKAYLVSDTDAGIRGFDFSSDGTTGLATAAGLATGDGLGANGYDLQGRRVKKASQPGVYIQNGKKVYIN